jgi:tRNA(Arg) A34 adenosine deaminase TadA
MLGRRIILGGILACLAGLGGGVRRAFAAGDQRKDFIGTAARMRREAIASGDQAYGAVVVKDGRVIGLGPSRVVVNEDPTAHAEMEALRAAARTLGSPDLSGCVMYSTSPPCRMCETAAYWANLARVYAGEEGRDLGKPGYGC